MFDPDALARLGWTRARGFAGLHTGEVQLWLVRVPPPGTPLDALLARLSSAERERTAQKRLESKRREYVTGQAVLRVLLAHATAVDPAAVTYRRGVKGKPHLAAPLDASRVTFNITHSGEMVMLALALDAAVGVDVEWHNERTDPARVARRAFTADERAAMASLPEAQRRRHFFQLWTCKEALVKCTGLGIHSGMANFQITLDRSEQGQPVAARVSGAWGRQHGVQRLCVVPLALGEGHAGALVHDPPALQVRYLMLDALPDPLAGL